MNGQDITHTQLKMIADSGSTKTDWCVCNGNRIVCRCATQGINPFHQTRETIAEIAGTELQTTLDPALKKAGYSRSSICTVNFYGAGCRGAAINTMHDILCGTFPHAGSITAGSDLLAAAHAVCGTDEGIACILGTGANSCLYDGKEIRQNVPPLGYILGDEGSGAVLGKMFVNAMFKGGIPAEVRKEFLAATQQTLDDIIQRVYREPMANRYLASMSRFIHEHLDRKEIRELVVANFKDFFHRNVDHYNRKDLKVGAVGSIAFHYSDLLAEAADSCGYEMGRIVKNPIDAIIG